MIMQDLVSVLGVRESSSMLEKGKGLDTGAKVLQAYHRHTLVVSMAMVSHLVHHPAPSMGNLHPTHPPCL